MRIVLDIPETNRKPREKNDCDNRQGRCGTCIANLVGTPGYKAGRESLNNKLKRKCEICFDFICKEHQLTACPKYVADADD